MNLHQIIMFHLIGLLSRPQLCWYVYSHCLIRARAPKVRGPIEIGPFLLIIRARAPKVRGPIEIGPFLLIIRARAPKVRGPIEIGPFLLIIIIQALWGTFWGL